MGAAARRKWVGASARQARRQAECQLLCLQSQRDYFFSGTATFLPLPIVPVRYRHIRSTLRHNRFHRRMWDNYPIWTAAAKTGVLVRDSNSVVTVKLPTRPADEAI